MTPDPLGGDVTNPQSLNRYAYAGNNPTTFTDPMGLDAIDCTPSGSGQVHCSTTNTTSITVIGRVPPVLPWYYDLTAYELACMINPDCMSSATGFSGGGGGGGGGAPAPKPAPLSGPQAQAQNACSTGSSNNHLSMGDQVDAASVNPFTSRGGGIWGGNSQSFPATTNNYTYSGNGLGVDVGVSIQSAWAWGSGSWSGPFHSVNWSLGVFSGSIFWTPGKGGWTGLSFGLGLGLPGVAYEQTNYTCKSGPG